MNKLARHGMRALTLGLFATMSVVVVAGGHHTAEAQPNTQVVRGDGPRRSEVVPDQYIVKLNKRTVRTDRIQATASDLVSANGGQVRRVFSAAVHGFSATLSAKAVQRLSADPSVESVAPVHRFKATDTQPNPPSWGLDRIDQSYYPLNDSYTYPNTASNVTAYVIDSGIRYSHQQFGGRATFGFDAFGGDGSDCAGHGTMVAGVLGGVTTGVAKAVQLVSVRVLDCGGNGTTETVLAGVDWAIANHTAGAPAVANLSLGGGRDEVVDSAVGDLIGDGVTVVASAGNDNEFTCDVSPAGIAEVITVGATDMADKRANFSNWGACNDLFAPGVGVTSASPAGDTQTGVFSGTSFSAPHVSGAAAMLISAQPTLTPAEVHSELVADTNKSHRILNIANSNPPATPVPSGTWQTGNPPAPPGGAASKISMTTNGDRVDAFVASAAPGRPILHTTLVGTAWTPWESLGGTTIGNPSAIWISSTRLELWVTGTDRAAWHRWWEGVSWHDWESLGGTVAADLVTVSPEPGVLDLYAISAGDSSVYWRTYDGYDWFNWFAFGGTTLKHNFSVAVDPLTGGEIVIVQGVNGAAYAQYFDGQSIYGWLGLGGTIRWDIKAVATSDGMVDIYVPGLEKAVWRKRWNRSTWGSWELLGGTVSGDGVEAVGWDAGVVDVYARSTDGRVYTKRWQNSAWSGWSQISPNVATALPSATGVLTYQLEVAYPVSGGVYAARWS